MILYYTIPIDTIHSYVPNVETILQSIQKMYHDMLTRLTPLPSISVFLYPPPSLRRELQARVDTV